jgi:hypothetical protein
MASNDTFFDTFKARWKLARDAEQEQRERELEDLKFEAGEHWDAKVKSDRERDGKPALTIDLTSGPIKLVMNQQRMARPGITISPVGHGTDPKKAEYWQGIIRRIERLSGAGRAYTWAGQHQVKMGRGFWKVLSQWVGSGFKQDIRIHEIDNQHTVYCDPTTKKLDGSDKRWAIVWCDYTHEDYIALYGESKLSEAIATKAWQSVGDSPPEWITSKHCRVAEYYYLEPETREKWLLSTGEEVWADEVPTTAGREKGKFAKVPALPDGVSIHMKRDVTTDRVQCCILNGMGEKLEEKRIPGELIPVVQIYGERRNIDGKVDYRGMVRMAKDANRMEDFCESSLMEAIGNAKTAPWLAEWTQIADFAEIWQTSNRVSYAVLPYKAQTVNGAALPPPIRVPAGVDVSHITLAAQRMQNHVRTIAGQQDVFSNESAAEQGRLSGRAYNFRRQQQELGTSDYMENLGDGIVLTAKIIMGQAREIYDTPQILRIVGADEKESAVVTYLGPEQEQAAQGMLTQSITEMMDLSGEPDDFDVAVSAGKRHDTARQETVDTLVDLIPRLQDPKMQQDATVALVKNMDGAGMQELAAKWDPESQGDVDPRALAQENAALKQQLMQASQIIETDQVKQQASIEVARMNNEAKVTLEKMKLDAEIAIQQMKLEAERAKTLFQASTQRVSDREGRDFEFGEAERGRAHDIGMAERTARQAERQLDRNAALAYTQSEVDAQHAQDQAAQGHEYALEEGAQQADAAMQQLKAQPRPNGSGA